MATAGGVKTIRPSQEIRLKRWPPGRVSQLKVVVANLEEAVNRSLAGQTIQSSKRRFSEFVPIIPFQDITGEVEFREIRVQFEPPKGLKSLLFYEFQLSRTAGFFQFQTFQSPDPSFVFGELEDNTTYYIRIRVVTTNGFVGPWSDNLSASTPSAKISGSITTTESTTTISDSEFTSVVAYDLTNIIGGKLYYSLQYNVTLETQPGANSFEYSTVEFRWMESGAQVGQNFQVTNYGYGGGNTLSIYDGEVATAGNPLTTSTLFKTKKRGTFIQKFHTTNFGELLLPEIKLEARIVNYHTLPNEFQFNAGVTVTDFAASSEVSVKNFITFEVLADA